MDEQQGRYVSVSVEQTAEPAARWSNLAEFCEHKLVAAPAGAQVAHVPLSVLREVIAAVALVAAAEERGAAKERERIAREIQRAEMTYEGYENSEHYRGGYVDGLGDAADIARGATQ